MGKAHAVWVAESESCQGTSKVIPKSSTAEQQQVARSMGRAHAVRVAESESCQGTSKVIHQLIRGLVIPNLA